MTNVHQLYYNPPLMSLHIHLFNHLPLPFYILLINFKRILLFLLRMNLLGRMLLIGYILHLIVLSIISSSIILDLTIKFLLIGIYII